MFLTRRRNKLSNINLSHTSVTTAAPGNLIPISFTRIIHDRKYRFKPSMFVQAFPMKAPLVNGFKVCLEYFFVPDRLYNSNLLLDVDDTTSDPDTVKYPSIKPPTYSEAVDWLDTVQVQTFSRQIVAPGSLADYMGFPTGYFVPAPNDSSSTVPSPSFNVVKALAYLDVVYNYYVNQQIPRIPTAAYSYIDPTKPYVSSTLVSDLREFLLSIKRSPDPVVAIEQWQTSHPNELPQNRLLSWHWLCSRNSIFQRCLPPYYLESWLATSGYQDAEIKVDLDADGNSISMRNISAMSHIQRWMDLAMAGGSRGSDYSRAQFDCSRVKNTTTPIFLGADRQYLGSNVIYQTTGYEDSASPLGSFAGQSSGGERFRERTFSFGENGYFMVIASLVPDVIYSRGLDPFLEELTLGDSYVPALDNISMEPLMVRELDAVPQPLNLEQNGTTFKGFDTNYDTAVGFVPAWSKLMQVVSRSHGRLTTELAYWLLERDYGVEIDSSTMKSIRTEVEELLTNDQLTYDEADALNALLFRMRSEVSYSPYVRPGAYNSVFADTSNEAQNFVLTFSATATALREKSKVNVSTTL